MTETRAKKLPRFAIGLLKIVARPDDFHYAVGDLGQIYESILQDKTPMGAWCWFWWEILRSLPGFAKNTLYWSIVMFKNYLKTTLRTIRRQLGYSFLNIAGLAVGMACSFLIMLWVQHELSFDSFHSKADRIYRSCVDVRIGTPFKLPASSAPMGPTMVEEYPEVLAAVRFSGDDRAAITVGDREYFEDDVTFADNSLFEVFDFPLIQGDPRTALTAPFTTVISETTARKYFGDSNPMGRILRFDGRDDYTVTGVCRDVPSNSHLRFNIVRSHETLAATNSDYLTDWENFGTITYLLLEEGADYHVLEQKMGSLVTIHFAEWEAMQEGALRIYFQPLEDIYLRSDFGRDFGVAGNITYVYGFTAIAVFILLIACVNFVNLTTARSASRAREVGLRKTFGAVRRRLIGQFLCEAILFCVASLVLAMILLELALPAFNELAECRLSLDYLANPEILLGLLAVAVVVGLMAGSYPAFFLSAFNPARTLKQGQASHTSGSKLRSSLVVFQFAISIVLIIATVTIFRQIDHMKNQDLGFSGEQVLVLPNVSSSVASNFDAFLNQLHGVSGVTGVSSSSRVPGRGFAKSFFWPEGVLSDDPQILHRIRANHAYLDVLDISLAQGRNFSSDMPTDATEAIIINEAAARLMAWDEPLGKIIRTSSPDDPEPNSIKRVIGVVKDFHQYSLQLPIEPLAIICDPDPLSTVSLKLGTISVASSVSEVEEVWRQFAPGRPFDYFFLDEDFDKQYRKEVRLSQIALYFCLLAIFIGCLGLFGMASYAAEQRTKEIGIRKVLGASTSSVVTLLTRQFLGLAALANLVAWPVAYYIMGKWLENFAYHAELGIGVFAASGLLALLAALGTVIYQAVKAGSSNPVDSLKCE